MHTLAHIAVTAQHGTTAVTDVGALVGG
jgi:hypothetical protein